MKTAHIFLSLFIGLSTMTAIKAETNKVKVHTIGDSTMADYQEATTRTRGWGEMLQEFFTADVEVIDYARGGRSSRSFYEEGIWQRVKDNMRPGDYVLIQFAHNDEYKGGEDDPGHRGTAPWTTYRAHLEHYVDETRALGGIPVLVTPIIRRYFQPDGTISRKGCHDLSRDDNDSILNYVRVMKTVARERQVQLVDMTAMTKQFAESLGKEATIRQIYVPTDGTHTQATGAALYAQLVAQDLKRQGILSDYLQPTPAMVLNPVRLDFDTTFVGDRQLRVFDVTGLQLASAEGALTLTAPEGMVLAAHPDSIPAAQMALPYTDGKLWNNSFFLYFAPQEDVLIDAPLTITDGTNVRQIAIRAVGRKPVSATPVTIAASRTRVSAKGLTEQDGAYTIEKGGDWPAEIDENANRYVEWVVRDVTKPTRLVSLSFTLRGDVSYRIAIARGKDFYPRTDLGELQRNGLPKRLVTIPINMTVAPGAQLNIRLFPWVVGGGSQSFSVSDLTIDAVEVQ